MLRQIYLFVTAMTVCCSVCSSPLSAQTTTINGDPADVSLLSLGPGSTGSFINLSVDADGPTVRAGHFSNNDGSNPSNVAAIFAFQLPDVGAINNPFTIANFTFNFDGADANSAAPTYNADLYGFNRRSDLVILEDFDFFVGPVGPGANAALLQEDVLTPMSTPGSQSVSIVDYLNAQYANGAGAGQFVLLRLSPDFNPDTLSTAGRDGFLVASADATNPSLRPRIEFSLDAPVLLGDVNLDTEVNFLDITPFIALLASGELQAEADVDGNGAVDFLDITPFIALLSGP